MEQINRRYILNLTLQNIQSSVTKNHKRPSKYMKELYFVDKYNNSFLWVTTKLTQDLCINQTYKIQFKLDTIYNNICYISYAKAIY